MVLAVIPARGGSKGIPRKNVRLMNGKPLIYYAIHNAKNCSSIDDVVVSSDDEEILKIASSYGVENMTRDSELAKDAVTLDPVIYDAVCTMEKKKGIQYDVVITLQVTSPLLSSDTLDKALESFLASSDDTYISVVNKPHLSWTKKDGCYVPNYEKRLNRQQLPPNYLETGAFLITRRECMEVNSRIGKKVSVYEMPEREAVDIDAASDWVLCEYELKKKRIILRADGYKELGMGHIYHCLTLAYNLTGQEILFVTKEQHDIHDKETLDALVDGSSAKYHELMKSIKDAEEKMAANKVIKTHIINYAKTRETYIAYRKSGYSKKFFEAHRDEITLHKAAKEAFSKLPDGKIPKVKDLNEEFARLLSEKKAAYSEYKKIKKEMRDYQIAKQNVESFYAAQQSWDIEEDMKKKRQQER